MHVAPNHPAQWPMACVRRSLATGCSLSLHLSHPHPLSAAAIVSHRTFKASAAFFMSSMLFPPGPDCARRTIVLRRCCVAARLLVTHAACLRAAMGLVLVIMVG